MLKRIKTAFAAAGVCVSLFAARGGVCYALPAPSALADRENPYADPAAQDYAEINYGSRKGKTQLEIRVPGGVVFAGDMRDSLRSAGRTDIFANARNRQAGPPKVYSAASKPAGMEPMEKEILATLNDPSVCQVNYPFDFLGPRGQLAGEDYKVRLASDGGPISSVVPPVTAKSRECVPVNFQFVVAEMPVAEPGNPAPLKERIADLVSSSGFKPYWGDAVAETEAGAKSVMIRGWIPPANLDKLKQSLSVIRVITGGGTFRYAKNLQSLKMDVVITAILPPGSGPQEFLSRMLLRLNETVGFVWQRTSDLEMVVLADDGGISSPAFIVSLAGRMPVGMVKRVVEYPYIVRIEPAGEGPQAAVSAQN